MLAIPQSTLTTSDTPDSCQFADLLRRSARSLRTSRSGMWNSTSRPTGVQESQEDRGAGHAVHVVVAVDANPPPVDDRLRDPLRGLGDAGQCHGRVKAGERRVEETARGRRVGDLPVEEQLRDDRRNLAPVGEAVGRRGINGSRCQTFSVRGKAGPPSGPN